jgi:hypothetical protein
MPTNFATTIETKHKCLGKPIISMEFLKHLVVVLCMIPLFYPMYALPRESIDNARFASTVVAAAFKNNRIKELSLAAASILVAPILDTVLDLLYREPDCHACSSSPSHS